MMRLLFMILACVCAVLAAPFADAAKKKQATPKPPKPIYEAAMTVVIVRSGVGGCEPLCPEWIAAEGEITGATPQAFRKVFKQMGKRKLPIIIRSPGGSINAALEIGRMIRKRKLNVAVGTTEFLGCHPNDKNCKLPKEHKGDYRGKTSEFYAFCNSACPMILAAGTVRLASFGTTVGVHQPKTIWTQERITYRDRYKIVKGKKKVVDRQILSRKPMKPRVTFGYDKRLSKKVTAYYREMGVDPAILQDSNKAGFSAINTLSGMRLTELKLRTGAMDVGFLTGNAICNASSSRENCNRNEEFVKLAMAQQIETNAKSAELAAIRSKVLGISATDPAMTVVVVRNSSRGCEPKCPEWISASGVISKDTPVLFSKVFAQLGDNKLPVVIDSIGGDFDAAIQIGKMISNLKLNVGVATTAILKCKPTDAACSKALAGRPYKGFIYVPGACHGACLVALAGGSERIGFTSIVEILSHAAFTTAKSQAVDVQLYLTFGNAGINNDLLQSMRKLQLEERLPLTLQQKLDFRLLTSNINPDVFSNPENCKSKHAFMICVTR